MKYRARWTRGLAGVTAAGAVLWTSVAGAQGWEDAPGGESPAADTSGDAVSATAGEPSSAPPPADAAQADAPKKSTPAIDVTTPEPEAPVARSYHVHDGFYLRINLGVGGQAVTYNDDITASGGSVALDLLVGGSPNRGLAIGGGLLADYSPNLDLEGTTADLQANVETGMVGVFIDGFPDPKGGFHLGGLLGLANISTDVKGADDVRNDSGFGGAVWVGYDAWVGDEWSVGGLLRFSAAVGRSTKNDQDLDAQSRALTLMFTALYH